MRFLKRTICVSVAHWRSLHGKCDRTWAELTALLIAHTCSRYCTSHRYKPNLQMQMLSDTVVQDKASTFTRLWHPNTCGRILWANYKSEGLQLEAFRARCQPLLPLLFPQLRLCWFCAWYLCQDQSQAMRAQFLRFWASTRFLLRQCPCIGDLSWFFGCFP